MKNLGKILATIAVIASSLLFTALLIASVVFSAKFIWSIFASDTEASQPVVATESVKVPGVEQKEPEIKLYTPDELLAITNQIRTENSVKPLELDVNLNKSAQMKLDEMTKDGVFEHVSAAGKNGYLYIADTTTYCYFGSENLQRVSPYVDAITDFSGSKAHWDAVNNSDYESVGFAMNEKYLVQHFCDKDN